MSIRGRFVGTLTAGVLAFGAPVAFAGTPAPAPAPETSAAVAPVHATSGQSVSTSTWDALAQCESGGDWSIDTGNGYGGGLQFTQSTWESFGGEGQPEDASKSEQIRVAENVLAEQGWEAWPSCSEELGLA